LSSPPSSRDVASTTPSFRVTRRHCQCVAVVFVRRRAALRGGGLRAALRGVGRLHAASRGGRLCAASRGGHLGGVVFTRHRAAVVFMRRCVGAWWSSSHAWGLSSRGRHLHVPSRGRCLRVAVGVVVGAVVGLAPGEVSACPPATARARDGVTLRGSGANQRRGERGTSSRGVALPRPRAAWRGGRLRVLLRSRCLRMARRGGRLRAAWVGHRLCITRGILLRRRLHVLLGVWRRGDCERAREGMG
jgi:hypothetical protein